MLEMSRLENGGVGVRGDVGVVLFKTVCTLDVNFLYKYCKY
jgi:hypothetical protein